MNPYWFAPSIAIAVPLILGPLGAYLRILRPEIGFMLVGLGAFLAFVSAAALPGLAAFATATGKSWRGDAVRASIGPVAVVIPALLYVQLTDHPPINDISTDLEDRPAFASDPPLSPEQVEVHDARMQFFANAQREAYPDVASESLAEPAERAFARALRVARAMPRWEVVVVEPEQRRVEATATTRVFGFVDEVVIRVRPEGQGSRLDVRSRSRVGRGDLGANARRIRRYLEALRSDRAAQPFSRFRASSTRALIASIDRSRTFLPPM